MSKVITKRKGNIFLITLNRPEVMNCVDGETAEMLSTAWKQFRDDPDLWVAVVTGAGDKAFCAGADLRHLETLRPTDSDRETIVKQGEGFVGYTRQTDIFKPILAAVNGYALAGGLEIACLADMRIAGENARFGVSCRRWGVPLIDGGTQRLPRIVGLGRSMELILTGKMIGAQEAWRIGLVNEVVPKGTAVDRALEIALEIASFPQVAVRTDKEAVMKGIGMPLSEGLKIEAQAGLKALESSEMSEGVERFLQQQKEKKS